MRWIESMAMIVLSGCVLLPEETFQAKYPREICGRAQACLWDVPADIDACREYYLDGLEDLADGCEDVPVYDEAYAKDCLSEIRALSCEASGYEDASDPPPSCKAVYDCTLAVTTAGSL